MENLLKQEQEKILASLSQILPGSSQKTFFETENEENIMNAGELSDILQKGNKNVSLDKRSSRRKKKSSRCPFTTIKRKRSKPKKKINIEENDSGFGTSSEILKYSNPECPSQEVTQNYDSDDSVTSMESVSLLQSANCLAMELDDASPGVKLAWNVKVFPPLEDDDEEMAKPTTDKSVQTIHVLPHLDINIMRNMNFISSMIRLKQIFSSESSISKKNFEKILKRMPQIDETESSNKSSGESVDDSDEVEVTGMDGMPFIAEKSYRRRRKDIISGEEVRFIMRQSNVDDTMEKSVDSVLVWLKIETEKDWKMIYYCWEGSVHAEVVDVLNEAVDFDVIGIRKKVSDFLAKILNEIHNGRVEDRVTEFKIAFLSNFCKSILLQYDLILHVGKKLESLISSGSRKENAKKIYFILRLLESLFRSFLNDLQADGFKEIFRVRPKDTDTHILSMWKKNWMKDDIYIDDTTDFHSKYLRVIREWCNQTDQMFNFSLKECPVLSLVAQKCSSLAREIISKAQELYLNNN